MIGVISFILILFSFNNEPNSRAKLATDFYYGRSPTLLCTMHMSMENKSKLITPLDCDRSRPQTYELFAS